MEFYLFLAKASSCLWGKSEILLLLKFESAKSLTTQICRVAVKLVGGENFAADFVAAGGGGEIPAAPVRRSKRFELFSLKLFDLGEKPVVEIVAVTKF